MKAFADMIAPYEPEKGVIILVTERDYSLDNGATWHTGRTASVIAEEEAFSGTRTIDGPSMSGFWGNCNEIRSGVYSESCRRFDGQRWRKI